MKTGQNRIICSHVCGIILASGIKFLSDTKKVSSLSVPNKFFRRLGLPGSLYGSESINVLLLLAKEACVGVNSREIIKFSIGLRCMR